MNEEPRDPTLVEAILITNFWLQTMTGAKCIVIAVPWIATATQREDGLFHVLATDPGETLMPMFLEDECDCGQCP